MTGGVVAADNCAVEIALSQDPPEGTPLTAGQYQVSVTATDEAGNNSSGAVELVVIDATPPVIALNGADPLELECSTGSFEDPGALAFDACDADVPVATGGDVVDLSAAGTYVVTYDAVDAAGNAAETVTRVVIVEPQTPTASAGVDQSVPEGTFVTLDASATTDILCGSPEYAWSQVGGTLVVLDVSDEIHPTFTAPLVPMGGETLTFQLIVSN